MPLIYLLRHVWSGSRKFKSQFPRQVGRSEIGYRLEQNVVSLLQVGFGHNADTKSPPKLGLFKSLIFGCGARLQRESPLVYAEI